jgi:hypothetical protein
MSETFLSFFIIDKLVYNNNNKKITRKSIMLENNINYILGSYLKTSVIGLRWFFDMISEP